MSRGSFGLQLTTVGFYSFDNVPSSECFGIQITTSKKTADLSFCRKKNKNCEKPHIHTLSDDSQSSVYLWMRLKANYSLGQTGPDLQVW